MDDRMGLDPHGRREPRRAPRQTFSQKGSLSIYPDKCLLYYLFKKNCFLVPYHKITFSFVRALLIYLTNSFSFIPFYILHTFSFSGRLSQNRAPGETYPLTPLSLALRIPLAKALVNAQR